MILEDLSREDCSAISAWLSYEIGGTYSCIKSGYKNQPPNAPFHFSYRNPVVLCCEERGILSAFIEREFEKYRSHKTNLEWHDLLRNITRRLGLPGYAKNPDLRNLCFIIDRWFPVFLNQIEMQAERIKRLCSYSI